MSNGGYTDELGPTTEIRSYRNVFDLERRIYRVDQLRLNPSGVPLRGIVYFLAIFATTLLAGWLPLVGTCVRRLPWYLRELALPGALAALLTIVKIEGRSFHLSAVALLRYVMGSHELTGFRPLTTADRRWCPRELVVLADGSDSQLRRMRYTGPGAMLVSAAHVHTVWRQGSLRRLARRPDMTLATFPDKPRPLQGKVIVLARGARLEVRR